MSYFIYLLNYQTLITKTQHNYYLKIYYYYFNIFNNYLHKIYFYFLKQLLTLFVFT